MSEEGAGGARREQGGARREQGERGGNRGGERGGSRGERGGSRGRKRKRRWRRRGTEIKGERKMHPIVPRTHTKHRKIWRQDIHR